jgi:hypothetical protein
VHLNKIGPSVQKTSDVSLFGGWLPEQESRRDAKYSVDSKLVEPPMIRGVRAKSNKNRTRIPSPKQQNKIDEEPSLPAPSEKVTPITTNKQALQSQPENTQPTNRVEQNRLYCMVPYIWTPAYLHAYHAIHATWGKRCHILRFMIDPIIGDEEIGFFNMTEASGVLAAKEANFSLPNDVVILHDMKRPWHTCRAEENKKNQKPEGNCRNIWEKIWRSWVYVATDVVGGRRLSGSEKDKSVADAYKAEWFVKVDADTFLFPENLSRYVESRNWSYNDSHYFGHVLNHRRSDRGVSIVAGAAVFFSRAALLAAADAFQSMSMEKGNEEEDGTCRDAYTGAEEVVTAVCLKKHSNITAEPAIDPEGREHVSLGDVENTLTWNRTDQGEWWFWEGKRRFPCHVDGDCLAYLPLAFHDYKDSQFFLDFEKEFYGSVMTGEKDDTLIKRNDKKVASRHWGSFDVTYQYFERVRAAMKAATVAEASGQKFISEIALHLNERVRSIVG